MTLFEILSTLLIGPLKLIFEIVFSFAYRVVSQPGLAVIVLSLVMNFLLLPLYKRTDAIQEASRDTEAKLKEGVDHIKKVFSGDERMMILQTYYRQNNYKPTDALNGSVSLLLEVPFFMAAYQFLSSLPVFKGVGFGPIGDLSAPDAMIVIGGLTLNALPVIMTVVNIVSSALYLKGFPLKTKIQLYAMALFFLVFLYNSPSALVLYWTMNNLFSLVKTLFYKLKNPAKVASAGASAAGLFVIYYALCLYGNQSMKVKIAAALVGVMMQLPLAYMLLKNKLERLLPKAQPQHDRKAFVLSGLFLTILTGLLIPSNVIAASPQEFVDLAFYHNPLWYLVSSGCLAAGTFLVWLGVFYWLASDTAKTVMDKLAWILCGVMLVNYLFFGTNLGMISSNLQFEKIMSFTRAEHLTNLLVIPVLAVVMLLFAAKWRKTVTMVLLTAAIALGSMAGINVVTINNSLQDLAQLDSTRNDAQPHFELSTEGNNVVVIMLDRAVGEYVPYLLNERPELKEQLAGFTFYPNTISFGGSTNLGSPSLYGGYEYTPVEMNKRSDELLVTKHNEALKMMPVLFSENGYEATVCDPPYANYLWLTDLTIYDDHPEINTYIANGKFNDAEQKKEVIACNHRNFFCYSIMKSMPLLLQPAVYNAGAYNQLDGPLTARQITKGYSVAEGMIQEFLDSFGILQNLDKMGRITDQDKNTFVIMKNEATHDAMLLQEPEYVPAPYVDNREYDEAHADRFTLDGRTLRVEDAFQMSFYQCNMATFIQLGNWFDYLRQQGVYDNTRIILVADHGWDMEHMDALMLDNGNGGIEDMERFNPLLMVKDFNSHEFRVCNDFMTNADVPTLAVDRLIENPVNPFTGKKINSDEKFAHDQLVCLSTDLDVEINNGHMYLPSRWAAVKDNLWDKDNWSFSPAVTALTEHALP